MPDKALVLEDRKAKLTAEIQNDRNRYLRNARYNYFVGQVMSWGSLAATSVAALLGLGRVD